MATTIKQQVTLDEALVPSAQRLRIGRSNFRLPSDIQSKESTLQVVYDVLRRSPFFKAFLVTADVPEIYINPNWMRIKRERPLIHHIIVARPTEKHVHAVKRIFRYLRGTVHRGLWYLKDSSIALTAFTDADHAGC
nr:uncharacterized mitochondrial protein AtMg00810-like [Tanacetum cinerariifolium]